VRLFVAVEPSAAVRRGAADIAEAIREALGRDADRRFRWIPAENLHLTLWFLGEIAEPKSAEVLNALRIRFEEKPFALHLSGLGTFPKSGSPRVLWLGAGEGAEGLVRLHAAIGERLGPLGFSREARPYSAHLTLARIKEPLPARVRTRLSDAQHRLGTDAGRCWVEAVTLFRSRTSPKGAVYEPLLRVPLK
jgi:2'-5' RNA ligase